MPFLAPFSLPVTVGFTNDPTENAFIKENKDVVLAHTPRWCGQYFLDISHPKFLQKYLPLAFRQVTDWGYEALKWDCLPMTLRIHDEYRENMFDQSISVKDAYRNMIKEARKIMGKNFYMLSCAGGISSEVIYGADLFDGVRIGGDIFTWDEFIRMGIQRISKYYSLHNVCFYNDPDNLVLREEFNTYEQAVTRACFVGLLGLPITFGYVLPGLPADRIELLKRILPPIDAHPMDIGEREIDPDLVLTNLAIEKPFESWNIIGAANLTEEPVYRQLSLTKDLYLDEAEYHIYDYWGKTYLGSTQESVKIQLGAYETKLISIRKKLDRPQIISTSRHITQGGVDLQNVTWNDKRLTLSGISSVIAKDPYQITLYVPPRYEALPEKGPVYEIYSKNILSFTILPEKTGSFFWLVSFRIFH